METAEWIYCPVCNRKTRDMLAKNTRLYNFPLFCPKCRHVSVINAENSKITVLEQTADC